MRLPALALATVLAGCSGADAISAAATRIAGSWTLESVNGAPPPTTSVSGVELHSSRFVAAGGSFTITSVVRIPIGGTPTELTTLQTGHYYCGHVGCTPQLLIYDGSGANVDVEAAEQTLTLYQPGSLRVYRRE